jgi:hypothetical protein
MKRIGMFGLALAALLAPAALRAQAIPVRPAGELSSLVGLPFDVPITADMTARAERLGSFALRLTWDPAVLRLDGGVAGSFGSTTVNTDSLAAGILRMAGVNPSGAAGMVTLGIARFTPISGGTTPLGLTLSELYASGSFASLLPSAVVSGGLYCPALGRFGDVDDDGSANSRDALVALSNAVGLDVSAFNIALGDVDGNGATNARDALIILSSAVGLDVSGFRVMRLAGGSCALNAPLTMSVTPSPLDLVLGQSAKLEARAANGSGVLQSLPDVVWKSSAPGVVAVTSDGRVLARSAGSAVVTALRGFTDSAQATITVVPRRTRHVVDALAVNATNQLGSAALPFGTTDEVLGFAQPGDTIELRPGRYPGPIALGADILLLGDTLLDGSRPTIFGVGDPFSAGTGVLAAGTGARRIINVGFENLWNAVEINGPDVVLLRGLRSVAVENGIVTDLPMASLRLERSKIIGRGIENFDSDAIQANYHVDTLVIEDTEIGDFGRSGVYAPDVDSVAISRSNIHDLSYKGLELGGSGTPFSLAMDNSTLQRSGSSLMYFQDVRSAVFTRNVLRVDGERLLYQFQENIPSGGFIAFHGDSIFNSDYSWLDVQDLDSVTVDSVRAVLPYSSGYISYTPFVRVRGGSFRDACDNVFDIYSGGAGGVADVRSTVFVGDPRCDLDATGIYTYSMRTTVDSVSFTNMYQAVETDGDSSLTVTNSSFRRVEYGVQFYGNYYVGCTYCASPTVGLTMRNNTMNGFYYGVEAFDGEMVIEDNTFVGGRSFGVEVGGASAQSIQRNVFDDVDDAIEADLYDSSVTAVIADNILTRATGTVIYVYGASYSDTIRSRYEILRNLVSCVDNADGIDLYYSDATVADNQITGCAYGVYLTQYGDSTLNDSILRNTITLPSGNASAGVYAYGALRTRISNNVIIGDTTGSLYYALIWVEGYYYTGYRATTLIDSNTISLSPRDGIVVQYVDTAVVAANSIQDVQQDGIRLMYGLRYFAAAQGNTIRRAAGSGVLVYDYSGDTTTMQVDSNTISGSGTGIDFEYGNGLFTRNTITGSLSQGIYLSPYISFAGGIALNNISGNAFGLRDNSEGSYAINNWWGDDRGPRCASECDPASLGDSVTNSWAVFPWLLAPNASSPPPAPRALATTVARAPRVVASRALPAPEMSLPPARTAAPERPARRQPAVAVAAATRIPAGLTTARAEQLRARIQQRVARAGVMQQAESRHETERVSHQTARREHIEQVRADARARHSAMAPRTPPPAPSPVPGRRP